MQKETHDDCLPDDDDAVVSLRPCSIRGSTALVERVRANADQIDVLLEQAQRHRHATFPKLLNC